MILIAIPDRDCVGLNAFDLKADGRVEAGRIVERTAFLDYLSEEQLSPGRGDVLPFAPIVMGVGMLVTGLWGSEREILVSRLGSLTERWDIRFGTTHLQCDLHHGKSSCAAPL